MEWFTVNCSLTHFSGGAWFAVGETKCPLTTETPFPFRGPPKRVLAYEAISQTMSVVIAMVVQGRDLRQGLTFWGGKRIVGLK